ncbi:Peptidase S26A, signal peptidase I [gut metagenome]|uniref:Peptidase S26A, signal peptidase I n=1 Tax=gut metagenome TaxID=749906 RepID=J9GJY0_9ZZZZ
MEEKRLKKNKDMLEWYDALVFAVAVLVLVFAFCVRIVVVSGHSMDSTLTEGDRLLVQSTLYKPHHGDVVVVDGYTDYGKPLVKRVIAVGGDVVDIDPNQGLVYVNGEALKEPYLNDGTTLGTGDTEFPITVPEGTLFLMGDNRQHSTDSRDSSIGCIDERDILGKVLVRLFPIEKFGRIE